MDKILSPGFAGSFYPSDAKILEAEIRDLLDNGVESNPDCIGILSPHAGLVYSGITAACAFAAAPDRVSTVIVCAPSHRFAFRGETVFDLDFIETPLGLCPVDRDITSKLSADMGTTVFHEHSFEVLVPFIQIRWPYAKIVPIILGENANSQKVANLVCKYAPDSLFVASSDLSHFYPLDVANKLDRLVIDAFNSLDPEKINDSLQACGSEAIRALLYYAKLKGARIVKEMHYSTSSDAGAGTEEVVGYFSGVISK